MAARLKTKVTLGVAFLFLLLVLVGGTGYFFLKKATSEQKEILQENYESLDYTRGMLEAFDSKEKGGALPIKSFADKLHLQEENVTEPGEAAATRNLRSHFDSLQLYPDSKLYESLIRRDLSHIMQINLAAITNKNIQLEKNASDAKSIITVLLTACFLLAFTFIFNFPGYIANPVVKLTAGIKAISGKKYDQRIHLNRSDEFGEMAEAFNQMAEQLDKYEHSNLAIILFEKQRAEAVINSLKDASIGIGKDGTILFANTIALQLLNCKESDILGKKEKAFKQNNDLFRFLMEDTSNQPFKIVIDNKEQFFNRETVDISTADGHIGFMTVLKDITPYKERDVAKTNFIATVSHELKTPLASSDFSLKLLEDERVGTLNTEQKELVQHLKTDNQRLLKILSELLDLSQVESGKIQLKITNVDPGTPVNRSLEAVASAAQKKNIRLVTQFPDNNILVKGDEEKIAWVLINFLTNAVKFSPDGSSVNIDITSSENKVFFKVTDHGTGIAPEYLPMIFDRFYQVPGTEKKGTGLGLSISKEFIEAMDGQIGVTSVQGGGSVFYFSLPLVL